MLRVAINGMGRIGRAVLKIILARPEVELVAVNDLIPLETLAYLLRYDTVYGRYAQKVEAKGNLLVDDREYIYKQEKNPADLPWKELDIDIVFECTGIFTDRAGLELHLAAGAKRVFLSAPAKEDTVETVVHGVNSADNDAKVISCGSCTTNCITPIVEIMGRRLGIHKAIMTTVHAYTATQALVDTSAGKLRRGRAAAANLVPTSTGAALATTKVLPELAGLFNGMAIRAPVPAGSVADIVFLAGRQTTVEEVNSILQEESETTRYRHVVAVSEDPLVSSDILQDPHAGIVNLDLTQVVDGDLVKIVSWYDNEWGYANQMVREALRMSVAAKVP
ncbi:MAG: type I glyceraldehyde-3-phosphate dehydrogenase [Desulfobulbaceae bacterium]|nr:type I glyceraldehyde-3-phosphate dehydrogenase [Desulfobulbaceae bacterium]